MGIAWEEYEDMRDGCGYLVVADVAPGSAAAALRLRSGSVLQTLNNMPITQLPFEELPRWLSECRPLQLGFSAPVEESAAAPAAALDDGACGAATVATPSAGRLLSPRTQQRLALGTPQPPKAAEPRRAFSARAVVQPVVQPMHGVGSPSAERACVAVAAAPTGRSPQPPAQPRRPRA